MIRIDYKFIKEEEFLNKRELSIELRKKRISTFCQKKVIFKSKMPLYIKKICI